MERKAEERSDASNVTAEDQCNDSCVELHFSKQRREEEKGDGQAMADLGMKLSKQSDEWNCRQTDLGMKTSVRLKTPANQLKCIPCHGVKI